MGKVGSPFLDRVVLRSLGKAKDAVVQGPKPGVDNAVIRMGGGSVIIVTLDPVSVIPSLGMETSAWLSVHLVASDYATSGRMPEFAAFGYNFPDEVDDSQMERYLKSVGEECRRLGVAIVAGNTGRYPGAGLTVVGDGTMFGVAAEGAYLLSSMARKTDSVVMTKGAAIETTGALSSAFSSLTAERIGGSLAAKARGYVSKCTVVKDAMTAAKVGTGPAGVTAMHDATEGGVLGGLAEMARASGRDFVVDPRTIPVSEETRALCSAFGIDPLVSLSEGTLLLTCARRATSELVRRLQGEGLRPAVIGEVEGRGGRLLTRDRKGRRHVFHPVQDPYWDAYGRAAGLGLA
jgi:hydrogenase expression/formation protein HypE